MDPRGGIVLYTELDDHCGKPAVDHRRQQVLSTQLTDDGPVYHAWSVHLCRFHDRYAEAKFSRSGVWSKVPEGSTLIFGDTRISL